MYNQVPYKTIFIKINQKMKQLKSIAIICFLWTCFSGFSQISSDKSSASHQTILAGIYGQVIDKTLQEPLPYVTITVENEEGKVLTGGITDDMGNFNIGQLPTGKVFVKIQYIGFKTYSQELDIQSSNQSVDLGRIELEEDIAALDEVVIVAEQSTISQRIDRRVVTVGKDLTTAGATASEIMNNIPSVNVDQDGNIALRGNPNVKILIDGKPVNIDAAQLLKQIPSTSIKQIELITNPSAKYNPEGMSGIINIILHKNTNDGLNGDLSVNLTSGEYARFNSSLNLNYRTGKFNFYTNYGNYIGENFNNGTFISEDNPFTEGIDDSAYDRFDLINSSKSHLLKVGADYYINDKNTLSIYTTQNFYDYKLRATNITDYFYGPTILQNSTINNDNISAAYNLAYKYKFNEDGHEVSLEADYNNYEADEKVDYWFSDGFLPSYLEYQTNNRENTTLNLDYVNPLNENIKIEVGLEARIQNTDNLFTTTSELIKNSDFFYNRNIYSGYVTFGHKIGSWSYQAGVRAESYHVDAAFSNESTAEIPFTDELFTLYPSAFVSYSLNDKSSVVLSYSRRVDRPGLSQINPIREFSTPVLTSIGNQNLKPQFTNSMELNYTLQLGKGSITAGGFYRIIEDEINRSITVDPLDPSKLILSYDNLEDNTAYGLEFSAAYRPTSWWNLNGSFDLYSQTLKGLSGTESVEVDNTGYTLRLNNSFKPMKDLTLQLFGFYRSGGSSIQFDYDEFYFVNAGVRYNVMQGKATISFNYNDIFNTQKSYVETTRPYPMTGEFNWESQTWQVGLSYRFGGVNNRALARKQRDSREAQDSGGFF